MARSPWSATKQEAWPPMIGSRFDGGGSLEDSQRVYSPCRRAGRRGASSGSSSSLASSSQDARPCGRDKVASEALEDAGRGPELVAPEQPPAGLPAASAGAATWSRKASSTVRMAGRVEVVHSVPGSDGVVQKSDPTGALQPFHVPDENAAPRENMPPPIEQRSPQQTAATLCGPRRGRSCLLLRVRVCAPAPSPTERFSD